MCNPNIIMNSLDPAIKSRDDNEYKNKSKSEVIRDALQLLQQAQLENSYREANKEIELDLI